MSKVSTKNLVGVSGGNVTDILGNVVWYSIGKGLITPNDLRDKLKKTGFEEWMPKPIRVVDAFRRATNFKHKETLKGNSLTKVSTLKRVKSDENTIVLKLVQELFDAQNQCLETKENYGTIEFNRQTNAIDYKLNRKLELARNAESDFNEKFSLLKTTGFTDELAFDNAATFKEETAIQTTQFANYLVREVYADKEIAIRHLVVETVDQSGKRLHYNSEAGKLKLNKKDGTLMVEHEDGNETAKYYVEEMAKNFDIFKGHYDSQAVRVMLGEVLKSLAPVALRNNGGVYFIPVSLEEGVNNFITLCNSINVDSNAEKLPVVDTFDQRQMVARTLSANIKELHTKCKDSVGAGLPKGTLNALVAEVSTLISNYKEYSSLINEEEKVTIENELAETKAVMMQLAMEVKQ